jgi:DNA-binding response OmpR family regulator
MKADALLPPVMVVDDDDDDVVLLTRHLKNAGVKNPVLHFRNGGDAFLFLKQFCPPEKSRGPLPLVMFLDVNMEGLSGFDVLVWTRTQTTLAHMKIFMLSGANESWDSQIAAKLGADNYFEKFPEPAALRGLLAPICTTANEALREGESAQVLTFQMPANHAKERE